MSDPAHVTSIEALVRFRGALIRFGEMATAAVDALRQESIKVQEWIDIDRPAFWRNEVRRGFNSVAAARAQLEAAQKRVLKNQGPSCIEEKVALRKQKQKLQFSQGQVNVVRRWAGKLQRESDDYRSRIGGLESYLQNDLPRAIALLERMIESLDRYTEGHSATQDRNESSSPKPKEPSPADQSSSEN